PRLTPKAEGNAKQVLTQLEEELKTNHAALARGEAAARDRESWVAKQERERTDQLIEARMALLAARDRVEQVERRQARQRERALAELDTAYEQARRAPAGAPGSAPARPGGALERKVDRLLREVEELRRELRRGAG